MDTCVTFRNQQSMPFMAWSREINDYIYKEYMLSEGQLYRLTPTLMEEEYKNDSLKQYITRLLNNFKIINSYVCDNNKIYPPKQELLPGNKELLESYTDSSLQKIYSMKSDTTIMPVFKVPKEYRYLFVDVTADAKLASPSKEDQPSFRLALVDIKKNGKDYLYWSNRDIVLMTKNDYLPQQWNHVSTNDMFMLESYHDHTNMVFELALFNQKLPTNLQMKQLTVNIYGIK
jgi:hypothetical protein